jgi:hypothetical protein
MRVKIATTEARIVEQVLEAAQVGFAAMYAARYQTPKRWSALDSDRQADLIHAAGLVREAYRATGITPRLFTEAFDACNKHRVLGVNHTFIGAVIGYYKDAVA